MLKKRMFLSIILILLVSTVSFATIPNPGHKASEIGGNTDADRTFEGTLSDNYTFPTNLVVDGKIDIATGGATNQQNILSIGGNPVSPAALAVLGENGNTAVEIQSGGTSNIMNLRDNTGSANFVFTNAGRLGVGTTNPTTKLHVITSPSDESVDVLRISAGNNEAGEYTGLLFSQYPDSNEWYSGAIRLTNTGSNPGFLNPRMDFLIQSRDTFQKADLRTVMSITNDGSGRIGIGTNSPSDDFDIVYDTSSGSRHFRTFNDDGVRLQRTGDTSGWAYEYGFVGNQGTDFDGFGAYGNNDVLNYYYIGDYTNEKMVIRPNGKIGIGTTNPASALHVVGKGDYVGDWGYSTLVLEDTSGFPGLNLRSGNNNWLIRKSGANQNLEVAFSSDASAPGTGSYTSMFAVESTGDFGIGTTTPADRLHVAANEGQGITIGKPNDQMGLDGGSYAIKFYGYRDVTPNAIAAKILAERTNECCGWLSQGMELAFFTTNGMGVADADNSIERMRIKSNGFVGIGTATPSAPFEVNGIESVKANYIGTTPSGYSEIKMKSDTGTITIGSIGSTYAGADWSDSSYIYSDDRAHFYLKSTGDIRFFTGGKTLADTAMTIDTTGRMMLGDTVSPGPGWAGTAVHGKAGTDKVISGHLTSSTNGAVVGSHNSALTAWADLNVIGQNLRFKTGGETERLTIDATGNVGIGDNTPSTKLDVAGTISMKGIPLEESFDHDDDVLFAPQAYFEAGTNLPPEGGAINIGSFVTVNDPVIPFSKVANTVDYDYLYSGFVPVNPGDVLYGEIWAQREIGATGTAGVLYYGIEMYDKDKRPIAGNQGCNYFVASAVTVPTNGVWNKYANHITLPTSHTAYSGSDGGPVRYVRVRILANYNAGTVPTKWGGVLLRKVEQQRDDGWSTFNGYLGVGDKTPSKALDVKGHAQVDDTNSFDSYSWTGSTFQTNSIEIVDQKGDNTGTNPTLVFHDYGQGGPQFRFNYQTETFYLEGADTNSANTNTAPANTHFNTASTFSVGSKLDVAARGKFGDYAIIGTSVSGGYYQDASNGAYRAIAAGGDRGYYFQNYGGSATRMFIGLDGTNAGRVGINTNTPQRNLDLSTGQMTFSDNVVTDSSAGIFWHSGSDYGIYRTAGAWASPNYQKLQINWATGVNYIVGDTPAWQHRFYDGPNLRLTIGDTVAVGGTLSATDIECTDCIDGGDVSEATLALTIDPDDPWIRDNGDNDYVRFYGNSRSMVFRTDGQTAYGNNGAYPFIWNYGGDDASNRRMILGSDGRLWTSSYGWLDDTFTPKNEVRDLGVVTFSQGATTTAAFISHLEALGAFDNYHSIMKASWSYAGNQDITDTGFGTIELAGAVVETWTDNADDTVRGNIHVKVTRPTTGSGGATVLVYNDQGSAYSPGWRQIWNSENSINAFNDAHITDNSLTALSLAANSVGDSELIDTPTFTQVNSGIFHTTSADSYDKIRVYPASSYTIGMKSGQTYGGLNDWATTFTMNNDADRGWLWRDEADAANDGAMSLTTSGILTVKGTIYAKGSNANGESITTTGSVNVDGTSVIGPTKSYFLSDVGIGVDTPSYKLDVIGKGRFTDGLRLDTASQPMIQFQGTSQYAQMGINSCGYGANSVGICTPSGAITLGLGSPFLTLVSVTGQRRMGLGTIAPEAVSHISGNACVYGSNCDVALGYIADGNDAYDMVIEDDLFVNGELFLGDLETAGASTTMCYKHFNTGIIEPTICSSLRELKENIDTLELGLDEVMKLKPVIYDWINGTKRDVGFIAEEVQEAVPQLSKYDPNGKLIGYQEYGMTALNTKAIQDLKIEKDKEINKLKEKVDFVEEENKLLREAICEINPSSKVCS